MAEAEGLELLVERIDVAPPAAPPRGFKGSPTVLIDGLDIDPEAREMPDSGHG